MKNCEKVTRQRKRGLQGGKLWEGKYTGEANGRYGLFIRHVVQTQISTFSSDESSPLFDLREGKPDTLTNRNARLVFKQKGEGRVPPVSQSPSA